MNYESHEMNALTLWDLKIVVFASRNFSNKKKFMEGDLNSPFKRNLSLRVNELPSTISRQQIMNPGWHIIILPTEYIYSI